MTFLNDQLHGVVLAGGLASRMGFPKALAPIDGELFVQAVYKRLSEAGITPVYVVANAGIASLIAPHLKSMPAAMVVRNREPSLGQIHSLQLGLQAARYGRAAGVVVALVDQPWIVTETVQQLVEQFRAADSTILIPRYEGRTGHPFVVPARYFDLFLNARPNETAKDVMRRLQECIKYLDVEDPAVLRDADSLADWPSTRGTEASAASAKGNGQPRTCG